MRATGFRIRFLFFMLISSLLLLKLPVKSQTSLIAATDEKLETVQDYIGLAQMYHLRSLDKAFEYSVKALELAKESRQDSLLAKAFKNLGVTYYYRATYAEAILFFDSALTVFSKLGDSSEIANIHNNLGIIYSDIGQPIESLDFLFRSLSYRRRVADSVGMSHNMNNIGALYYEIKAYSQALDYFEQAYDIASALQDDRSRLSTRNNIGLIQLEKGNLEEAKHSFLECIVVSQRLTDVVGEANALNNLGDLYLNKEMPDSALVYYQMAVIKFEQLSRTSGETLNGMGRSYYAKGNFRKASDVFRSALKVARDTDNKYLELNVLKNLFESYNNLNDKEKALETLIEYHDLFDQTKILFDSTALTNIESRFKVERKLADIETLEREKVIQEQLLDGQKRTIRFQHIALTVTLIALVLFIMLLFIAHRFNVRLRNTGRMLEEKNKETERTGRMLSRLNEELTVQKELLLTLINATPDMICFKDGQGRWLQANKAILEVFSLEKVNYHGHKDSDLAGFSPFFRTALESCEVTDEITWQKRTLSRSDEIIPQPDGNDRIFDVIKVPLFQTDGSRKGLIVLGRDITQRKNAEDKLVEALHKAEESDKLKSAFLTNISHEIRTPLNAIIGFSEILKDPLVPPQEQLHFLSLINDNGHLLLKLISDIIDLSRIEAGETKLNLNLTNLNKLFHEIYAQYQNQIFSPDKHKFAFDFSGPDELVFCKADESRLRQIVEHLLDNAFKFTEVGKVELGFEWLHDKLHIWVSDTGPGIPVDKQEMVFKRFIKLNSTGRRLYSGTGLGLSIAEQMVRLMEGKLWFESMVEQGTIFHVSLPLQLMEKETIQNENVTYRKFDFKSKTILIVEDVESSYELLKLLIEPTGALTIRAVDGKQAVDLCLQQSEIDLVLMDIHLPLMNGLEATRQIKKHRPGLPVVAQTAYALTDEKEACFEAGCDGYIAKPIRSSFLLPVISEILEMSQ